MSEQPTPADTLRPLIVATAVLAFMVGPLMRYGSPPLVAVDGAILGGALLMLLTKHPTEDPLSKRAGHIALRLGLLLLGVLLVEATWNAHLNDERCLHLQMRMDAGKPSAGDDAQVFQAFGCRPQTNDLIDYVTKILGF